jgi:hypothetical protein
LHAARYFQHAAITVKRLAWLAIPALFFWRAAIGQDAIDMAPSHQRPI